ncbi:ribonuclease H-like domain-containing protein [Tanacetum coccineum]
MAFVLTPGSTNKVDTANIQVSTVSTPVSTTSTNVQTANLSDATVYAFLANHLNGSQLVHEDLEQIHEDDLEEMDLKWQLALLSMRARRCHQRTGKNITINGSDTTGYDKSNVECFNCHKMEHFARECRSPKDTSSKVMVAIDGTGFDWSFMADEEVPTNMALMAFLDLQKNEVMFYDQIVVLKRDASFKDSEINALNIRIEKHKKEKESNQIKINNFENASKSLDKLIGSQISDNSRKVVGFESYNVVAPLPTGLFAPLTIDLSNSCLKEFQQPEFEGYELKANKSVCENSSNEIKKTSDATIIKEWVFDSDEDETEVLVLKYDNVQHKPEQANQPRKATVLTKSGIVPVSVAKPINTTAPKPFVNVAKPRPNAFQKSHSLTRRPFYQQTIHKIRNLNEIVNTAKVKSVNTAKGNRVTSVVKEQGINAVKTLACWVWRPKIKIQDHGDPQVAFKDTGIFNSGCSRHMTGNKSYLIDYQEYNGGFVAFAGSSKGVSAGNRTNGYAGLETNFDAGQAKKEKVPDQDYILLPLLHISSKVPSSSEEDVSSPKDDAGKKATKQPACDEGGKANDLGSLDKQVKSGDQDENFNSINSLVTASPIVNVAGDTDENFYSTNDDWTFQHQLLLMLLVHLLVIQMLLKIILSLQT